MNVAEVLKANLANELPLGPTDWYYKNIVPKDFKQNIEYRRKMLEIGYSDPSLARELKIICSRDILFEINTFGWTYNPKTHPNAPVRPFITYESYQDGSILDMQKCISDGTDVAVPKSRDMGASWIGLLCMEHRWRHMADQTFLVASRKAELVDKPGDMDALLTKIDWYIRQLPLWLQPKWEHFVSSMTIRNYDNGSVFSGEATVENLGTGGRRTAIFLDEVSKMAGADSIFTSTRDVTDCRIFNSTPNGRFGIGEPFYKKCRNPDTRKIFMHWSDHPEKRNGLYYLDEKNKPQQFEEGWNWRKEYDFDLLTFSGRKPRSPWYDLQCRREDHNYRKIAQELDINFVGSGMSFVNAETVSRWMTKHAEPPVQWGMLLVDPDDLSATWQGIAQDAAPFKLWVELTEGSPPPGRYVVGADISAGTGGELSSNSALIVIDEATRKQVGRFISKRIKPVEFGRFAAAVCTWFHDALLVPETNGPGKSFIEAAVDAGYWNIYRRKVEFIAFDKETEKLGLPNNDRGTAVLEGLVDGIESGKVVITDEAIYRELSQYEWHTDGRVIHSGSRERGEDGDRGVAHGDMAIAAACAYHGVKQQAGFGDDQSPDVQEDTIPDYPCYARRMADWEQEKQRLDSEEAWTV